MKALTPPLPASGCFWDRLDKGSIRGGTTFAIGPSRRPPPLHVRSEKKAETMGVDRLLATQSLRRELGTPPISAAFSGSGTDETDVKERGCGLAGGRQTGSPISERCCPLTATKITDTASVVLSSRIPPHGFPWTTKTPRALRSPTRGANYDAPTSQPARTVFARLRLSTLRSRTVARRGRPLGRGTPLSPLPNPGSPLRGHPAGNASIFLDARAEGRLSWTHPTLWHAAVRVASFAPIRPGARPGIRRHERPPRQQVLA